MADRPIVCNTERNRLRLAMRIVDGMDPKDVYDLARERLMADWIGNHDLFIMEWMDHEMGVQYE